jgi:hypothetical protein
MAKPITDIRRLSRKELGTLSEGAVWQGGEGRIIDANAAAAPKTAGGGLWVSVGIAPKIRG